MANFEVVEIDNPRWKEVVESSYIHDFHHTDFYHSIDNDYRAVLFVATEGNEFVALPLVIRPIERTGWFDATSVYGYGGAIASKKISDLPLKLIHYFRTRLKDYLLSSNIISVFSRLHPLIEQVELFETMGKVVHLNKTVSIDLTISPDEQRRQYRKSNKSEINQLKKKGIAVEEVTSMEDIERFIDIYYETMDRVNASSYYYFSREYFHRFVHNKAFETKLLISKHQGKIIAGAIFTITKKIMQYHLAGTTSEYITLTPMKLILDEARLLGGQLGVEHLHLGGGVGGSDDDSLFRFKSGFSKNFKQFSVWKYVVDEEKYNLLVNARKEINKESKYFPLYRA